MSSSNTNTSAIENERSKSAFVMREAVHPGIFLEMALSNIYVQTESEFQQVSIVETPFGKTLVTDGKSQSAKVDEYIYHESLVHPAFVKVASKTNKMPKKVFIGGGGELATAREVLRHKSVEKVVMVDLDGTVLNVCRKHLHEWGGDEVATNPRLELIIGDAYEYLMNCSETFDVIIMDISDPIEAGPGIMLYTKEFYTHAKTLLNKNGVFVTQSGSADPICLQDIEPGSDGDMTCFAPIKNTLSEVFDCVLPYSVLIPSFGTDWGFVMAYSSPNPEESVSEFTNIDAEIVDDFIKSNIGDDVLGYYDGVTHKRSFSLPKPVRVKFSKDKRIMTKENPVFMY